MLAAAALATALLSGSGAARAGGVNGGGGNAAAAAVLGDELALHEDDVCLRFEFGSDVRAEYRQHFSLSTESVGGGGAWSADGEGPHVEPPFAGAEWDDAVRTFVNFFHGVTLRSVGMDALAAGGIVLRATDTDGRAAFSRKMAPGVTVGGSGAIRVGMRNIRQLEVTAERGALRHIDWCEAVDDVAVEEAQVRSHVSSYVASGSCMCLAAVGSGGYQMQECEWCSSNGYAGGRPAGAI